MSLGIERSRISAVMIANEWIECYPGSFTFDAYEFCWSREQHDDHDWVHFSGEPTVPCYGFFFERLSDKFCVFGPATSIQAVAYALPKKAGKAA
jgi:hypothetical protein